jgi:hypothetical protein
MSNDDIDQRARDYWINHHKEVAGNGSYPLDPKYIDEFIEGKARSGPDWAIAYALLQVADAIRVASQNIAGVDDFTGIMRIGAELGILADATQKIAKQQAAE